MAHQTPPIVSGIARNGDGGGTGKLLEVEASGRGVKNWERGSAMDRSCGLAG